METLLLRFLFGFCILFQSCGTSFPCMMWGGSKASDKMRLTDVQVLTLQAGNMTNGRRSPPVDQLRYVGGSANWIFTPLPQVVQCYNRGTDGYDVQWECKTEMSHHFKFGNISVNCEGYDYPSDPYILKGSCGLSYTLDWANQIEWSTGAKICIFGLLALFIISFALALACGDPKSNRVSRPGDRNRSVSISSRSGSTGSRSTSGYGGTGRR